MQLIKERQINPIESEVLARISIIRPILTSLLIGIKQDVVDEMGGINNVKLKMLPRASASVLSGQFMMQFVIRTHEF